jgi:hypothetical protein
MFGGAADHNTSAYDGHVITDSELGVALPYRFSGTRPGVRVYANGTVVDCAICDVGPWNTNNPYWTTGSRPQAESGRDMSGRATNRAGIDLTPAAAKALGIGGKGVVDWEFIGDATMPNQPSTPAQPSVIVTPPAPQLPPIDWAAIEQAVLGMLTRVATKVPSTAPAPVPVPVAPAASNTMDWTHVSLAGLIGAVFAHQSGLLGEWGPMVVNGLLILSGAGILPKIPATIINILTTVFGSPQPK